MTHTPEHRAAIGAANKARNMARRAGPGANGETLAQMQARGVEFTEAQRLWGTSGSVVRQWERDTGLTFVRVDTATRARRAVVSRTERDRARPGPSRIGFGNDQRRVAVLTSAAQRRESDPDWWAGVCRERGASISEAIRSNPDRLRAALANLAAAEDKRRAAVAAKMADPEFRAAKAAQLRSAIEGYWNAPDRDEKRAKASANAREQHRAARVRRLQAKHRDGVLDEASARLLLRSMTAEERMMFFAGIERTKTAAG